MKVRMFSLILIGALLMAQTPLVLAQGGSGQWAAVQAIAVDERLVVKQKDGKSVEGRMIEATDMNLSLSKDKKVVNISRDNIREIYRVEGKAAKGKWAAIGTAIGAGAGAGIGATKYRSDRDDYIIYPVIGLIIGAGGGAVGGLIFGASRRNRTLIFQAP
jgi:hypothetical protein